MIEEQNELNFIVIEGNIGAGKTSLSNKIAENHKVNVVLENFADNPFLPKFYKNPDKYSFQLETSFLIDRFDQLKKQLHTQDIFSKFVISDYYFPKSLIFAKNTLQEDEFNLYRKIFYLLYKDIPIPDLYVYLHLPVSKLLENIKKRGRDYEQNIEVEYLENVQKAYYEYFKTQKDMRVLILHTENVDFVNNEKDYNNVVKMIFEKKYNYGITTIRL